MYQNGCTPLLYAAVNGRFPMVEYLLEKGADPSAQDYVNEQLNTDGLFVTLVCSEDGTHCMLFAMVAFNLTK